MPGRFHSGELARLLVLGGLLLLLFDVVVTLRINPIARVQTQRSGTDAADDVFREVLSPQSTLYRGLALGSDKYRRVDLTTMFSPVELLGDVELSRASRLRDPGLATVFSSQAARKLPRLGRGPSITLAQQLGPSSNGVNGSHTEVLKAEHVVHEATSLATSTGESGTQAFYNRGQQNRLLQEYTEKQTHEENVPELIQQQVVVGAADPPPPDLDVNEATIAGQLASIAYCSHPDLLAAWNCTRCVGLPGFTPHRVVYDTVWDLAAYAGYYAPWDAVVLSFRGTDSSNWGQWAENMRAWRTDHMYPVPDFPHAFIHAGFYTLWTGSSLQATFTAAVSELMAVHPKARLVATGHSMGGALAQLAGLEFKLSYNTTHTTVYTYGAPRVGNVAYQQLFNSFVDISWRFTHNRDIVPSVPLQLMGFQHVAREVWEVDVEDPSRAGGVERKLLMCDASGEDPSCHNSACYLGLCTSIADHLLYLGLHMYQDSDEC